jgi:uncharacterized membrane protein YtjA (UPF0391 family)
MFQPKINIWKLKRTSDYTEDGVKMATLIQLVALFVILAIVFAVLGKRGIAGISWSIAKWLFIAFIVLAVIAFIF